MNFFSAPTADPGNIPTPKPFNRSPYPRSTQPKAAFNELEAGYQFKAGLLTSQKLHLTPSVARRSAAPIHAPNTGRIFGNGAVPHPFILLSLFQNWEYWFRIGISNFVNLLIINILYFGMPIVKYDLSKLPLKFKSYEKDL